MKKYKRLRVDTSSLYYDLLSIFAPATVQKIIFLSILPFAVQQENKTLICGSNFNQPLYAFRLETCRNFSPAQRLPYVLQVRLDYSVVFGFAPSKILISGHFLLVWCTISSLPATLSSAHLCEHNSKQQPNALLMASQLHRNSPSARNYPLLPFSESN